jgi:hypothetical protein
MMSEQQQRILVVCQGGKVRSVAIARELRLRGYNAQSVSIKKGRAVKIGAKFADRVLCVDHPVAISKKLIAIAGDKVSVLPTGKDVWHHSRDAEVLTLVSTWLDNVGLSHDSQRTSTTTIEPEPVADATA